MRQLILPEIKILLRGSIHDEYSLTGKAEEIVWKIHGELSIFEPCGDDDQRSIWMEIPRGKITDWMNFDDAVKYGVATTREEYEQEWLAWYPRKTEWIKITTAVYENNVFFYVSNGRHDFASFRGDNHGNSNASGFTKHFEKILNEVRLIKERILKDVDAYNEYVETNLPKQIREGRIHRKDLYRILPWKRPDLSDRDKITKMLHDCKEYSGTPLDQMTIRSYCKYYRIAHKVYHDWHTDQKEKKRNEDYPTDDIDYYRTRHFHKISPKLDLDSEEDFMKFKHDHYGELGFSRTDIVADNHTIPGKWTIRISPSYSSQIWLALEVALALYEAGIPLRVENADRLREAVQESDCVRLTSHSFHNYISHQEEISVYVLPWEDECQYEIYGVTAEQLQDLISHSEWLPVNKLKIQKPIPLESPLYDLMRDKVTEPMFLHDIRLKMWKDYDTYVGTYHYNEFSKHGYCPSTDRYADSRIYDTWSEAVTAGLLKLIDERRTNEDI